MVCRMFASHVVVLLLVISSSLVFSKKTTTPSSKDDEVDPPALSKEEIVESSRLQPSESKLKSRCKGRHGDCRYILHEDEGVGGHGGGKHEAFILEEGNEEQSADEHDRGYHNEDKKLDDETLKEFSIKGTDQDFREGGASFDKHHKDRASENKENEHVNEHDEGEKFGAEALKEHKLGKHKEKSVGHKKHGFKNVYHKEEYGDHKTFHDEFLDNDHHHEYDDQHENRKLEGGRFSKGYFKEGENKELDEGDENHAWGKGGHDSRHEGNYEEGGHITGHRQGHKKKEGHHEASGHKHKHSKHKVKKGEAPLHSTTHHHHDDHQPQYYARNHKTHDGKEEYSKVFIPDIDPPHKSIKKHKYQVGKGVSYPKTDLSDIGEDHDIRHLYNNKETDSYSSQDSGEGDLYPKEFRTHARLPEPTDDVVEPIRQDSPRPTPVVKRFRVSKPLPPSENHSFYYRNPQTEAFDQTSLKNEKPLLRVPQAPDSERHNPLVVQSSPKHDHHIQHHPSHNHQPGIFPTQLTGPNHHQHNHRNHHHGDRNHHHRHVVVSQPVGDREPRSHVQNHHPTVSKPYPWWKHSGRHGDSAQASSQHRFGHERVPYHHNTWVPQNKFRYSEPYEHVASRQHYGYAPVPEYHNVHQQY